jgi:hypothetical protein
MWCPQCETLNSDTANFCSNCGRPLNRAGVGRMPPRQIRWEFTELTIPIGASSRIFWEYPEDARARFAEVVQQHLERASLEGWQPDEPTDWDALKAAGRVAEVRHRRFGHITLYESVTIRLRRVLHQ